MIVFELYQYIIILLKEMSRVYGGQSYVCDQNGEDVSCITCFSQIIKLFCIYRAYIIANIFNNVTMYYFIKLYLLIPVSRHFRAYFPILPIFWPNLFVTNLCYAEMCRKSQVSHFLPLKDYFMFEYCFYFHFWKKCSMWQIYVTMSIFKICEKKSEYLKIYDLY